MQERSSSGRGRRLDGSAAVADSRICETEVVAAYARWAPIYDAVFGAIMDGARRNAVQALPRGTTSVLEVGVGTGISLPLYSAGTRVTGIDLSPHMLEIARKRVAKRRLTNVDGILEMDASAMSFESGSFDAVMAMYVMTVVPDAEAVMAEMRRVVRPGGRVLILSHFASEKGLLAQVGQLLTPLWHLLGWNARITSGSLMDMKGLRFVSRRPAGLSGFYSLLEFEAV
ncbi:Demethylmenaquinone methyltransferase [Hartmannibacter diazotrophicus]|uniref:Demethylmenaquinone methyltransferase n=1 Tax=Hartmannibacter diazotrophicus TaxID=1482074 RepID=A0A2C9DC07_9HYPH|nr:class I SAM-dependent methyltransferase [Hartmannibacter diazotrophicus]SON57709.1 Demethylmenaquinone methyltransferase [Hartmannibacter diazotrophicus]